MTGRRPCPVAPGPLEEYAARFDDLFGRLAQRRGPAVAGPVRQDRQPRGDRHYDLAGERIYYPVQAMPYTPARHFAKGKNDPAFRTELAIGAGLAIWSREVGFAFRAVVADSAYGDQDRFRGDLAGTARALAWGGPDDPGDWTAVARTFRDGHAET